MATQTQIAFSLLQTRFARAYRARDRHAVSQYADKLQALMIAIACGGVAL